MTTDCLKCEEPTEESSLNQNGVCVSCSITDDNAEFVNTNSVDKKKIAEEVRQKHSVQRRKQEVSKRAKEKPRARKSVKERYQLVIEKEQVPEQEVAKRAQQERVDREQSRRFLLPFIQRFDHTYEAGWFHKDLARRLEKFSDDVAKQRSPRLMLFVPPRHGKSITTSVNFPAWHLGHHPDHEFMVTSYSADLATGFSRKVRQLIENPRYTSVFPRTTLKDDSRSVQHWLTTEEGGLLAAGVGGPMTGMGANILIIDDPVKNAVEAESETTREMHMQWYSTTAYTRLAPGGGVLVIMTRWNFDDLAGKLLEMEKYGGDEWEVVEYPAVALEDETYRRKGEALHSERYPIDALNRIERAVGQRTWWSLYQQKPSPDEGSFFLRENFTYFNKAPPLHHLRIYAAWDFAVGQKQINDFTSCVLVGIDHQDRIFVLNVWRIKKESDEVVELILEIQKKYKPLMQGMEKGQISLAIGPFLRKRMAETKIWVNIEELLHGNRDKVARAMPIQGRTKQGGMVLFDKHAGWIEPFESELLQFPNGKHDDQVDAFAYIGQMFDTMSAYRLPNGEKPLTGWRDRLAKMGKLAKSGQKSAMRA
jgi:predicted phage terminase large subunit-like protein